MGYPELSEDVGLKVFALNTCQTGREYQLFDEILDFLNKQKPDVVLFQEVWRSSLQRIENALGGEMVFSQFCNLSLNDRKEEADEWGVAIGSRHRPFDVRRNYYAGNREEARRLVLNNSAEHPYALLQASVEVGSNRFNFGTTHFTWHNDALPSVRQLRDFAVLERVLDRNPDLVLAGDFNSPRGHPIFDSLGKRYRDNIPADVDTTFDTSVRPEAIWKLVVDGFFTSPDYRVGSIRMIHGLSDHQGILAQVQRVELGA